MTLGLTAANDVQPRDPAKQFLHLIVTLGEYWASISQGEWQARQQEMTIIIIASGWGFSVRLTVFLNSTAKITALHCPPGLWRYRLEEHIFRQCPKVSTDLPPGNIIAQRQIPYDIAFMWNLKKWIQMSLFVKQKQTHIHGKQIFGFLSLFTFMHWRRKWQPTPMCLPGESQGWRSLVGCCLWGHTESDTTEVT